jgi:hypothetical protein
MGNPCAYTDMAAKNNITAQTANLTDRRVGDKPDEDEQALSVKENFLFESIMKAFVESVH